MLDHIEEDVRQRKKIWEIYREKIGHLQDIAFFADNPDASKNYAYLPVIVKKNEYLDRDKLYEYLKRRNIFCRKYFYPLTLDQVCFENRYKMVKLEVARNLAEQVLVLPLYSELKSEDLNRIINTIKEI